MSSGTFRAALLLLLSALAILAGCPDPPPAPDLVCATDAQCPSGHHCAPTGRCAADRGCASDADCCLAERCLDRKCRQRQACSASASCLDPAAECLHGVCIPRACADNATCGAGRTCLWGACVGHTPCGGLCPAGQACAVLSDRCVGAPAASCPTGTLPVLSNEKAHMSEGCATVPRLVECKPLPALPEGERGWPGTLVGLGGMLAHVAYDRTYGDVVVTTYAASPPFAQQGVRWLMGVPSDAAVVGAPSGPRRGIAAPGADVGRRLAAVSLAKGQLAVAARNDSSSSVEFADVSGTADPVTYTLTQGVGVGEALAMTVTQDGRPVVVAFSPARPADTPPSAARVTAFVAQTAHPADATQWQISQIDTEPVAAPVAVCGGPCPAAALCALSPAGKQACVPATADCAACLPGQVCSAGKCLTRVVDPAPLDREAQGRGASLSVLTLSTGQLAVAAYSSATHDLAIYRNSGAVWTRSTVPPAVVPGGSHDFGRFVRLLQGDGGALWAVCEDGEHGRLLLIRETPGGYAGEVLDSGASASGLRRVGADLAAARHPFGGILVAYQDTRRADLLLLRQAKPGAAATLSTALTDGATGFSSSVVQLGAKAWVVGTTTLRLGADGRLHSDVHILDVVWNGD